MQSLTLGPRSERSSAVFRPNFRRAGGDVYKRCRGAGSAEADGHHTKPIGKLLSISQHAAVNPEDP
jgi:hypothetical protein